MKEFWKLLMIFSPMLIAVGCMVLVGFYFIAKEKRQAKMWKLIAEGKFDHVEYGIEYYTHKSDAMIRTTARTYSIGMISVFLDDGRSFTGKGHHDMPFPRGTKIKISKNPFDRLKIEKD